MFCFLECICDEGMWAASRKRVPNDLSSCHTFGMTATFHKINMIKRERKVWFIAPVCVLLHTFGMTSIFQKKREREKERYGLWLLCTKGRIGKATPAHHSFGMTTTQAINPI